MKQRKDGGEAGAGGHSDGYIIITECSSPLERQLLEHRILLANQTADTQDVAGTARDFRKLRLLESLVAAEKAKNPHYAVTRLLDPGEEYEGEAKDNEADDNGLGRPPGVTDRLIQMCGLVELLDASLGDLTEERQQIAAVSGERAAEKWFRRQVLRSILPRLPKAARTLAKSLGVAVVNLTGSDTLIAWLEAVIRRIAH